MARSILKVGSPIPDGVWYNRFFKERSILYISTVYPGWMWKADTSSDEVTGHLMVYPLVYDLVAESESEKKRVKRLIYDITHHIVENGFFLIDVTGKPTTWGKWSPDYLNHNSSWYDQRGLNALQVNYLEDLILRSSRGC